MRDPAYFCKLSSNDLMVRPLPCSVFQTYKNGHIPCLEWRAFFTLVTT
jgi:hypothetical protein